MDKQTQLLQDIKDVLINQANKPGINLEPVGLTAGGDF